MRRMKADDTAIWLCGSSGENVGYINGNPCSWYGSPEILPGMEYERAIEGEVFDCDDGTEFINREGWREMSEYTKMLTASDAEKKEMAIWM